VSPGNLVAAAAGQNADDVVVWRWYEAVVLGAEDDDSVRLREPAHGEVVAKARATYERQDPGTRAYASAGLPGAEWWIADSAARSQAMRRIWRLDGGAIVPTTRR